MGKEFSAGAIIFRKPENWALFLLVYSKRNKIWCFPKGHIEPEESEKEAALREIKEETGISDLRFVDGFREEDIYKTKSNRGKHEGEIIEKHSIYFLCETSSGLSSEDIVVDGSEIADYKWLSLSDAKKLLTFDSLIVLVKKAEVFAHLDIPKNTQWKRIAISHKIDRYVLDISKYTLPYYEVQRIDIGGDDHRVYFVVPGNHFGMPYGKDIRDLIDECSKYWKGPYYDHIKAIKEDSKKRGLPSDIEADK